MLNEKKERDRGESGDRGERGALAGALDRLSLPTSLASLAKRLLLWVSTMTVILALYGVGKLGAALGEPTQLPLTAIDRAIPLLPWTVWLYGTITWACLGAWLTLPSRSAGARLLTALVLAALACACVFLIFPVSYPRELYPLEGLPEGLGELERLGALGAASVRELARLRAADSPSNCLPSLHVALAWALALTWSDAFPRSKPARVGACLWAVAIALTTLTTKQHYLVDVPAGAAVGALSWWAARRALPSASSRWSWVSSEGLRLTRATHVRACAKLRAKAEAYQWSLDEIEWPKDPLPPLDPTLVRLINELIYVEEIAGMNFAILAQAARGDEDLRTLYELFAAEEKRHAEGLRRVLAMHGASLRRPGLGNSLVLAEFDALDAASDADVLLIATANPVFETMLDAGTVPFLRTHPALASAWFEDFVTRITRDESAHLAVNWMVIREAGARFGEASPLRRVGLALSLLFNPSIGRGMLAVPFMSLDVYSLAHRLGYRFETLLPAFGKLWRLHERYAELRRFPLWWVFRLFTAAGALATVVAGALARTGLIFIRFWTGLTRVTDGLARLFFGRRLLDKRGLPD